MPNDHEGEIDNHFIAVNQGDLPEGVVERAKGGMKERGGQAGPSVGGSGVHGMQDDANRGPLLQRDDDGSDQKPCLCSD
jgi:hypothetical protein